MLITIDGYSWSGKSTTAAALSKLLGFKFINTGLMYRYISLCAKKKNLSLDDEEALSKIAKNSNFNYKFKDGETFVSVNNKDITHLASESSLVPLASKIANHSSIRQILLEKQRNISKKGDCIFEGRDTGSVVFPEADWKFFIKADLEIRIERFYKIANSKEKLFGKSKVKEIIEKTDERDLGRKIAPLECPEDAVVYNNTLSPTPYQDAMVIFYYINSFEEIKKNISRLTPIN